LKVVLNTITLTLTIRKFRIMQMRLIHHWEGSLEGLDVEKIFSRAGKEMP